MITGSGIEITGCISEDPDVREGDIRYTIKIKDADWKVLVFADKYPQYKYGDCLKIYGEMVSPNADGSFDYSVYLRRYGIYKIMHSDSMELLKEKDLNCFFEIIYGLKHLFEEKLGEIFTEPYRGFMAGLLFGSRSGLPKYLMENFKTVGLSHVVAISGYNITLVIVCVSGFFWFLRKEWRVIISSVFVIIFVVLVGMSASAVRAAIMGIIGLFALRFGRQYYAGRGLLITVFLMSLWNPYIFFDDAGFHLSVLATLGLMYIYPVIKERLRFLPKIFGIDEVIGSSLAAQIAVAPLLILNFKQISVIGIFANLLVLPLIPITMLIGFLAVAGGFLCVGLGKGIGFLAYLVLKVVIVVVEFFANIPFASIKF
jgi:competence protein ComEC